MLRWPCCRPRRPGCRRWHAACDGSVKSAIVECPGIVRLEADALGEVSDHLLAFAVFSVVPPAIVERIGVGWVETDSLGEVGDGQVVFAFYTVGYPAVVEWVRRERQQVSRGGVTDRRSARTGRSAARLDAMCPSGNRPNITVRDIESGRRQVYFRGRPIVVHMAMAGPCPGRQFSSQVGTSNTRPAAVRIRSTHLPCGPLSAASGRKIPGAIIIAAVQGILLPSRSSQHPCSPETRSASGGRSPASATPPDRASHIATTHHESERRPVCANLIFRRLMLTLVAGTSMVSSRCRRASRNDDSTYALYKKRTLSGSSTVKL